VLNLLAQATILEQWERTNRLLERLCLAVEGLSPPIPEQDDREPEFYVDDEPPAELTEEELREMERNA